MAVVLRLSFVLGGDLMGLVYLNWCGNGCLDYILGLWCCIDLLLLDEATCTFGVCCYCL